MPIPPRGKERQSARPSAKRRPPNARLLELKRQIKSGEYETPEKLDVTLRRILADLKGPKRRARATRGDDSAGGSP